MDPMLSENSTGGCGCSSQQAGGAKRKLSDYNKFMKKEMADLKKRHPSKSAQECMKMAAKKWKMVKPKKPSTTRKTTKTRTSRRTSK